jgi:CRP-like cAMP-binding protein
MASRREIGAGIAETADRDGAFPRLHDEQLARLRKLGRLRNVEPGEVLFAAGDAGSDFFVVEEGAVAIVQGLGQEDAVRLIHQRLLDLHTLSERGD